ncbi:MAG: TonB-dependent receptor [Parvularcula sp.]|jgi:hypothetical protein|nr:TonB-dependent receptor [Parvularcula sp.]
MFDQRWAGGVAALAIAASISSAYAQEITADIRGDVFNQDGAPIAGATVTVVNNATGFSRSVTTGANGGYSFRGLGVTGAYTVTVTAPGFDGERIEGVALSVGQAADIDFRLGAGTSDEIIVRASRPAGYEVAVGPSSVFGLRDLNTAPAINRNITDIIRLDPRVFVDESAGTVNPIQCAGQNPRFNSLTLDGVRLNDGFGLNSNGYPTERQPFPFDAIEQVAVELAPFDVQYGGFTACNINAVTKSGTNEFHGVAFYDYTDEGLQGDSLEGAGIAVPEFDEQRYGIQVAGPIIQDKLFFSVAYEKFEGANIFNRGPLGSGAINEVPITQEELDEIAAIARDVYGYDPGPIPTSFDNEDEKLLVKLDWQINDQHRAAFTYNYNDGFNISESDSDLSEFEFANHLYERGAELNNYVGFLFSDWTENFSTEFRLGYVDLNNRQNSIGGTDFGEIRVETDDVDVYLGGDDSRQSNQLNYEILNVALKGFYTAGAHNLTFGFEREGYEIFNLFVQHTETEIRFEGIENFRNGFADSIYYNNAPSNNPEDAAAEWGYALNTVYFQDEWDITPALNVILGLRYDLYTTNDRPAENETFVQDYGFSNNENLDGKGLLQPRLAFTYETLNDIVLRGGVGRYSGGNPNVWLSNTYSANNVLQFGQRGRSFGYTDGSRSLFDSDVQYAACEEGVPSGPGYCIPQELFDAVAQGVGDNFEINYLDPDFEIPAEWKFSLGATWNPNLNMPGNYTVNADLLYSQGENSAIILRGDLEQTGTTEEGYPIYDSVREPSFVLTNAEDEANRSFNAAISVAANYDNGIDWSLGYSYNDAQDVQPMTSSVAFSNYVNRAFFDPQEEVLSTSNYNISHRFVGRFAYEKAFFGDYATRISTVGLLNSGRPYAFTFDGTVDPYNFTPFLDFQPVVLRPGDERNSEEGSWWGKVDLRFDQELPGLMADHRTTAFVVIDNFTNLLNDEWGVLRQADFPLTVREGSQAELRIGDASLYQIRFGVRYDF